MRNTCLELQREARLPMPETCVAKLATLARAAYAARRTAQPKQSKLSKDGSSHTLTTSAAAAALGVTQQTVRNWIAIEKLAGVRVGRAWRVSRASVDHVVEHEGRKASAPSRGSEADLDALAKEVRRLADGSAALAAVAGERDRYRAEAATLREAATQVNAASREAYAGMQRLLDAMRMQSEALSQLLGPRTPDDVLKS